MQVADKTCPECPEVPTLDGEKGLPYAGAPFCEPMTGNEQDGLIIDFDGTQFCITY